jgi:hypothetical protein
MPDNGLAYAGTPDPLRALLVLPDQHHDTMVHSTLDHGIWMVQPTSTRDLPPRVSDMRSPVVNYCLLERSVAIDHNDDAQCSYGSQ